MVIPNIYSDWPKTIKKLEALISSKEAQSSHVGIMFKHAMYFNHVTSETDEGPDTWYIKLRLIF